MEYASNIRSLSQPSLLVWCHTTFSRTQYMLTDLKLAVVILDFEFQQADICKQDNIHLIISGG